VELPDLNRIVDTYVPVSNNNFPNYLNQLKSDLLPHIRRLQSDGHLPWFSFLLHGAGHLDGREPNNGRLFIHIRLEPNTDLELQAFINSLPPHFLNPIQKSYSQISGLDGAKFNSWAHAWKIHGEASEWVLCLLEGHRNEPSLEHVIQFMHFITNPLMLGQKCLYIPAGFAQF